MWDPLEIKWCRLKCLAIPQTCKSALLGATAGANVSSWEPKQAKVSSYEPKFQTCESDLLEAKMCAVFAFLSHPCPTKCLCMPSVMTVSEQTLKAVS